ncbi:hypothetical protein FOQG_09443 [Fusarium oxysporum f. sp. raphani 54005]|jgi:hypothetical protein|uniref:Uncharacterized protein n=6 Tax=Fusarium oxysporum TaxID=5507 RepID=W9IDB4_FUSOX|nr:hypothetical protein FOYG_08438 [Fusarium oxysporum NRRL 32931]EWZ37903.1 hypothetical protein FOZG_09726 [Fusarium oxysporum Fo47]EWZ79379.1 hypothetical protein FOWG_16527 [Fusarium oxysporum f. sp. lycopersici MN25]EXA45501.1 hypothetical protein FOVG_06496 [Fusarium oxysporum f. sp. pisi HDV247]EXK87180.1 hypothetical protein FOQG_09443 [Fusarium oxysporum f. sp. raphani 54005]EXL57371.1 hypothetical protein FOCG_04590 [Fusarium oxysporum f. sp. radicis-lycopersici 26381]EXL74544.1 hyp
MVSKGQAVPHVPVERPEASAVVGIALGTEERRLRRDGII